MCLLFCLKQTRWGAGPGPVVTMLECRFNKTTHHMVMRVYEAKEVCVVSKRGPPRRRARSLCNKHPQLPGRRAREARCLEYGEAKEACVVTKRDLRGHQQGERETRARESMSHLILSNLIQSNLI